MARLGVSDRHVVVDAAYTTAESYVFLQPDGERSIIMASGATSLITDAVYAGAVPRAGVRLRGEAVGMLSRATDRPRADRRSVHEHFAGAVHGSRIVSTEISQVPLSGVLALLRMAHATGALTVLDIDISPAVAEQEAKLGSLADLLQSVRAARVLKPARHAAEQLLEHVHRGAGDATKMSAAAIAEALRRETGAAMVAMTSGREGCALALPDGVVTADAYAIPKVVDATGAGDAFLGGLMACLYHWGLPSDRQAAQRYAHVANAAGAACCEVLGALPHPSSSRQRLTALVPGLVEQLGPPPPAAAGDAGRTVPEDATTLAQSIAADAAALRDGHFDLDACVETFSAALDATAHSGRHAYVTGIGKSGLVAHRMAASLASIGIPASYVHAAEWAHGDLGSLRAGDALVAISHSGRTAECIAACQYAAARGALALAIVGAPSDSALARAARHTLRYRLPTSAPEPLGGVPTSSIIAQEALVNAIVRILIARRQYVVGARPQRRSGLRS